MKFPKLLFHLLYGSGDESEAGRSDVVVVGSSVGVNKKNLCAMLEVCLSTRIVSFLNATSSTNYGTMQLRRGRFGLFALASPQSFRIEPTESMVYYIDI